MSTILDALRRGRGGQPPRQRVKGAQTDVVLQTLGYGQTDSPAAGKPIARFASVLALVIVLGMAILAAVAWFGFGGRTFAPQNSRAGTGGKPNAPGVARPPNASNAPVSAPVGASAGKPAALQTPVAPRKPVVPANEDAFQRAVVAQRLGDYETAVFNYKQVLQRDNLNVAAHNNLGLLHRSHGLPDDAAREFQRAIALDPKYVRARNNLGVLFLSQRKFDAAAEQFHAALAIDPKNVESFVNLSIVEKDLGRREAARTLLTRAIELDRRTAEAHFNLGVLEDESGNREHALTQYRLFLQFGAAAYPGLVGEVRRRIETLESGN